MEPIRNPQASTETSGTTTSTKIPRSESADSPQAEATFQPNISPQRSDRVSDEIPYQATQRDSGNQHHQPAHGSADTDSNSPANDPNPHTRSIDYSDYIEHARLHNFDLVKTDDYFNFGIFESLESAQIIVNQGQQVQIETRASSDPPPPITPTTREKTSFQLPLRLSLISPRTKSTTISLALPPPFSPTTKQRYPAFAECCERDILPDFTLQSAIFEDSEVKKGWRFGNLGVRGKGSYVFTTQPSGFPTHAPLGFRHACAMILRRNRRETRVQDMQNKYQIHFEIFKNFLEEHHRRAHILRRCKLDATKKVKMSHIYHSLRWGDNSKKNTHDSYMVMLNTRGDLLLPKDVATTLVHHLRWGPGEKGICECYEDAALPAPKEAKVHFCSDTDCLGECGGKVECDDSEDMSFISSDVLSDEAD